VSLFEQTVAAGITNLDALINGVYGFGAPGELSVVGAMGSVAPPPVVITTTGTVTSGSFTVLSGTKPAATIQWNSTAAQCQAALAAIGLSSVCTGGPLPGTGINVVLTDASLTLGVNSLGGTTPVPVVTPPAGWGVSALQTVAVVDRLQNYNVIATWQGSGTVQIQNSSGVSQLSMTAPGQYFVGSLPTQVKFAITAGAPIGVIVQVFAVSKGAGF